MRYFLSPQSIMKTWIPYSLVLLRLALAPVLILIATAVGKPTIWLVIGLWIGLLSDIFDGILARKWGVATEALRRDDAHVDVVFWLAAGFCVWWLKPEAVWAHSLGILGLFCLEPISDIIHYVRFRRDGCAHNWLSKMWGLLMLVTFSVVLGWGYVGNIFGITVIWGLFSQLDRILIASLLPTAECDIPSAYHAYLRKQGKTFKRYKLFN